VVLSGAAVVRASMASISHRETEQLLSADADGDDSVSTKELGTELTALSEEAFITNILQTRCW